MANVNLDSGGGGSLDDETEEEQEQQESTGDTGGGGGTSRSVQFTSGSGDAAAVEEDATSGSDPTPSRDEAVTASDGTSTTREETSTQDPGSGGSDPDVREADFTPEERSVRNEFAASRQDINQEDISSVTIDEATNRATIQFTGGTTQRVRRRRLGRLAGTSGAMLSRDEGLAGVSIDDFGTVSGPDPGFEAADPESDGVSTVDQFTSGETDQPAVEERLERRIAMENPGVSLSDVSVRRRDDEFEATLTGTPQATDEELEQLEQEAETASVTVPGFVPVAGGTTITRQFRDVELEQTEEGTIEVTDQERFGDFDIQVPFTDKEFEEVTGAAGDTLVGVGRRGGEIAARELVTDPRTPAARLLTPTAIVEEKLTGDTAINERFVEGVPVGAANIGSQALNLPQEAAEFSVEAGQRTASGEFTDFAGDVGSAAAGKGVVVAQEASADPVGFTGQLAGSALLSAGAISAAGRFGGPRTARATSVAIQPGEELAIAAARRGAIPTRAATAVPGVRRNQIRSEAEEFLKSERGGLELTGPRSRSETSEETTVITGEDLETGVGDPGRPATRPMAEEAPELAPDDPASAVQRRRRRAQQSEVTRTTTSRIEGVEDPRPSPALEERVPPGFRQRQEAAQRQEVTAGETELVRDGRLFETIQQSEVTAGAQQRLAEAQSAEAVLDEELEATGVETGLEEREELREEVGLEELQETRQEMRQETRQEARLETAQEVGVESRSEARREIGVEARREIGIESDFDLDIRSDSGGGQRRRRGEFDQLFEFDVAASETILEGETASDLDEDI